MRQHGNNKFRNLDMKMLTARPANADMTCARYHPFVLAPESLLRSTPVPRLWLVYHERNAGMRHFVIRHLVAAGLVLAAAGSVALAGGTAVPAPAGGAVPAAGAALPADQSLRLLMVTRRGCIYCERWDQEVGPGYAKSDEGRRAPLMKVDLDGAWPDNLVIGARPYITPTFILLRDGQEVGRLQGYPGDEFFYPLLSDMLDQAGSGDSAPEAEG